MATIKIRANVLESVSASPRVNLLIAVDMTEHQMFDALKAMLEHVTDETWQQWVSLINEDGK